MSAELNASPETAPAPIIGQALSDATLRYFFESSPVLHGVVELLPDGDLLHHFDNAAVTRFFGGSPSGRRASHVGVPAKTIALWRQHYEAASATGRTVAFDYVHRQPGLGERMLAVKVAPLRADSPNPPRLFCYVAEDVTERRAAETALAESEALLQATVEQAAVGIAHVGLDGRWLRVNARLCSMFGYSEAELLTRTFQDLTHPDDLAADLANVQRLLAGEAAYYNMEKRYLRADGSILWGQLTVSLLHGADGEAEHFISVVEDISARKAAEARAAETERRFREALEAEVAQRTAERDRIWNAARELMVVARPDGVFLSANPAWEKVLGWRPDEIIGRSAGDFLPPEDIDRVTSELSSLQQGILAPPSEHRHRHKDGSWRWISWSTELHQGLIYAIGRDVTEEKLALAALEQAETALRQAAKMEALGRLTGGIAHDFNNLLAAIVGSLELIRKHADNPTRVGRYAEMGLDAAERGARLTSQLLAFSRAQKLALQPTALSDLLANMQEMLHRALGPQVRLVTDLQAEGVRVRCDKTQFELAILNLAINARDAMPEGGALRISCVETTVQDDPELSAGRYVRLSVADEGVGMNEEVLARIFEPFFTTKPAGKGTGLGLSQVYAVVHQAMGSVRVVSRPGAGTTVVVLLPVASELVEADEARAEAPGTRARTADVLIVDDDPDVRRVAVAMLDALGCRVTEAADGATALALIEAHTPELLLLDFAMPGMTGAELARTVSARHPDLPIVFVTGYADSDAIQQAVGNSALVLRKPFRMDQVQKMLNDVLDRRVESLPPPHDTAREMPTREAPGAADGSPGPVSR